MLSAHVIRGLWFILFVVATPGMGQSSEVDQIITRYFEAKGGIAVWREVQSIEREGDIIKYKLSFGQPPKIDTSHFRTLVLKPDWYKQIFTREGRTSILCIDNDVFWQQSSSDSPPTIERPEDVPHVKSVLVLVGVEDVFLDSTASISFMGQRQLEGKNCNVLRGKKIDWLYPHDYYFDEDTGSLLCSEATVNGLRTFFRDYRPVDGLVVHFLEEVYDATGALVATTFIKSVKINAPMPKTLFEVPN